MSQSLEYRISDFIPGKGMFDQLKRAGNGTYKTKGEMRTHIAFMTYHIGASAAIASAAGIGVLYGFAWILEKI